MAAIDSTGLTQDQRDAVKKAMGLDGEEQIDELLNKLQKAYPDGYKKKEQFFDKLSSTSSYKSLETKFVERIFAATDLDKSGTADFYELLMTLALIRTNDPQAKMQWLFALCDSDHDGSISQADVIEVLTILMVLGTADPASAPPGEVEIEQTKSSVEAQCKELVETIFVGKAQVQVDQFRQGFGEKEGTFFDGVARYFSMGVVGGTM